MRYEKEGLYSKEALKQLFQTCPKCGQVWLIFGMEENDEYTCQACNHSFIIQRPECSEAEAPQKSGAMTAFTLGR